jgi:hypothetical protein
VYLDSSKSEAAIWSADNCWRLASWNLLEPKGPVETWERMEEAVDVAVDPFVATKFLGVEGTNASDGSHAVTNKSAANTAERFVKIIVDYSSEL